MTMTMIAAMDNHRVLGYKGKLPWHLPDDLARFKRLTMGKVLIMGRKTYESLPVSLPGRELVVISRTLPDQVPGIQVVRSFEQARVAVGDSDCMVTGGAWVFEQALPVADAMWLTFVDAQVQGDTFFPEWSQDDWRIAQESQHVADDRHDYAFRYVDFVRAGT
jgi:dihydrofolate reductase